MVGLRYVSPDLNSTTLASDHLCLLAADEVFDQVGTVPHSLEALASWPLIMREDGSGTKTAFLKAFSKRPDLVANLHIVAEVEGLLPALGLARAGVGVAVISQQYDGAGFLAFKLLETDSVEFHGSWLQLLPDQARIQAGFAGG